VMLAKAGEIDKKPFLEQSRDWVVQIGRLREQPQFANDQRSIRCRSEKIRNKAEARGDLALEIFLAGVLRARRPWETRNRGQAVTSTGKPAIAHGRKNSLERLSVSSVSKIAHLWNCEAGNFNERA